MQRPGHAQRYGYIHRQARKAFIAVFQPGQPCVRCGHPIRDLTQPVDLDHTDDGSSYRGLAHRYCNRSAGARKRNAIAAAKRERRTSRTSRDW